MNPILIDGYGYVPGELARCSRCGSRMIVKSMFVPRSGHLHITVEHGLGKLKTRCLSWPPGFSTDPRVAIEGVLGEMVSEVESLRHQNEESPVRMGAIDGRDINRAIRGFSAYMNANLPIPESNEERIARLERELNQLRGTQKSDEPTIGTHERNILL